MANITAADVKKLRELTGAGMMDCKKALDEADGDFDKAVEILRIKGGKPRRPSAAPSARPRPAWSPPPAARWSSSTARPTSSPRARTSSPPPSRSPTPPTSAKAGDVEALKAVALGDRTVGEVVEDLAITIGEKIELGRVAYFDGPVVAYMHKRAADLPPAVGVLVEYDGDADGAPAAPPCRSPRCARSTSPATRSPRTSSPRSARSPRRPPARRASPSRRSPRSSRAASTASSRTSSCSSSRRSPRHKKSVKAVLDEAGTTVKRFARFEVGA